MPEPEPVEDATRRVEIPEVQPIAQKAPEPEKKKVNKGLLWGLICGGTALLVGLIILLVVLLGKKTVSIDVTQYVDFKVSGYDGYGIAICEMDWDGLEVAAFGGMIRDTQFGAEVEMEILVAEADAKPFLDRITDMTAGTVEGMETEKVYRAFPVQNQGNSE